MYVLIWAAFGLSDIVSIVKSELALMNEIALLEEIPK